MSFPKYPAYKESGVACLGEIPERWSAGPLKRVMSNVESGTSVNSIDTPAENGDLGVLKTSCVYGGSFNGNENKRVVEEEYHRVTCPLRSNTLIVSRMNTPELVGAAGLVTHTRDGLYLPDRLWQVSFDDALPKFAYYWTLTVYYRAQVQAACTGTSASMQNLSQSQFCSFVFPCPTLSEQSAIAAFLDRETAKIDALVAEQEKLIELLKEKRQAVISHAVTKGLDPNVPMKDSGVEWLGEVPEHWEIVRLKRAVMFQRGHDLPNDDREEGNIPVVSSGGIIATHSIAQAKSPGIVTGRYGTIGNFIFVNEDYWPLNTSLYTIEMNDNNPRYLWYLLQSISEHFILNSLKSAVPGVDRNDIHAVMICIAHKNEQNTIALFLDKETYKIDTLMTEAQRAIDLLKERRAALISAAVTGKIDVRSYSPEIQEAI